MLPKLKSRYGLIQHPFSKDLDTDDFFEYEGKERVTTRLKAALLGRASAVLSGEAGTGKTFCLRALEAQLPPGRFKVTYIHNSTVNLRDFYRQLSQHLGLEPRATPSALFRRIRDQIRETSAQKTHPVLVLDEAHLAPIEVLKHLHILLNFERDSKPLLSILLLGLPSLRDLLARNALSALAARLPVRVRLDPLDRQQIGSYLRHRLSRAGCSQEVFAPDAVLLIAEATAGVLRKIDVLASTALEVATESRSPLVDASAIEQAVKRCAEAIL